MFWQLKEDMEYLGANNSSNNFSEEGKPFNTLKLCSGSNPSNFNESGFKILKSRVQVARCTALKCLYSDLRIC